MSLRLKFTLILGTIFLSSALLVYPVKAVTLAGQLSGRILLQVESHGEAWYVNPQDNKKYYLGKPNDAYNLMRRLSTGISEKEFASWSKGAPVWARGRLYLRPQSHGEAYYVDLNRHWYYLGQPQDAWWLFRSQGLGISNSNLNKILSATNSPVTASAAVISGPSDYVNPLSWLYNLENFKFDLPLKKSLNSAYAAAPKTFYYTGDVEPLDSREKFYAIFFNKKSGDTAVKDLVAYGKSVAASRNLSQDQLAEFLLALVQYIPYDNAKLNQDTLQPNYPYETLYKDKGICSDKTFLAVAILRELGYGAAILDFPDLNHSAAGISCPLAESINNSGYCYVETTNYFPVGVIPPQISNGQALSGSGDSLANLFDSSRLSKIEIFQKTQGLVYQGVSNTRSKAASLEAERTWIESQKLVMAQSNTTLAAKQSSLSAQQAQLSAYQASGDIKAYNTLVVTYNALVIQYNNELGVYRDQLAIYNDRVNAYNEGLKSFYQQ
ncbi:MAG: hypothetical protein WCK59_03470 [Candidatus Falkowbacteria bacterium]